MMMTMMMMTMMMICDVCQLFCYSFYNATMSAAMSSAVCMELVLLKHEDAASAHNHKTCLPTSWEEHSQSAANSSG